MSTSTWPTEYRRQCKNIGVLQSLFHAYLASFFNALAPVFCRPSTSGHIGPGANSYPAGLVVVILGGRGTSLLSSQERSKEALPAAIKAFGLLYYPPGAPPGRLAQPLRGWLYPAGLYIRGQGPPNPPNISVVVGGLGAKCIACGKY